MKLFPLADEGLITLPEEVNEARRIVALLDDAERSLTRPERADALLKRLIPVVAETGTADSIDAAVAEVTAAEDAARQYDHRRHLVTGALRSANARLDQVVKTHRDQIITDHLAPVVASVVEEARTLIAKFRPHGTTDNMLLQAPKPARDAWVAYGEAVRRYGLLQGARASLLWGQEGDLLDGHGLFAEVRNTDEVWPEWFRLVGSWQQRALAPWTDDDPAQRMMKLLHPRAEVWCPTLTEQNQRWLEVYGEAVERQRQSVHDMHVARSRYPERTPAKAKV